ncbi:hypothetical protein CSKR_101170 [Clonorchis sinensis]|uniref:VPS9 domain-containing protein n=1 Tax=Clonorchis sinensis TaxID=79923 RepID=A0A8T1MKM8_CLOSI|nr:hypothetical protein CSKR_101170 [Clonorchis sinensis]
MQCFVRDLRSTTSKLFRDEVLLSYERQNIQNMLLDGKVIHEDMLKLLWILHRQRVKLLFSGRLAKSSGARVAWFTRLHFDSKLENSCYSHHLEIFRHLRDNPNVIVNLLVLFESNPEILEILCFLTLTTVGNFAIDRQDVSFLANVIHAIQPHSPRFPMNYTPFASLFNVCFCDTHQAHGFMCVLLHDVVARISEVTYVPDRHSGHDDLMHGACSVSRSIFYSDVRCLPRCFSEEEFCLMVNLLIRRFIEAVPLFPQPLLVLLKIYRQRLASAGDLAVEIFPQSVEFLTSAFMVRAIVQPLLYGYYSDQYLDPSGRKILHQVASAFKFLALNCIPSEHTCKPTGTTPELGVSQDMLMKQCDVAGLHEAFERIFEQADKIPNVSPAQIDGTDGIQRPKVADGFRNKSPFGLPSSLTGEMNPPPITIVTASDLNVLIGCLRILVQQRPDVHGNLRKMLDHLPERVPGSLVGVRSQSNETHVARAANRKDGAPSGSSSKQYELVCLDPSKDSNTLAPNSGLPTDSTRTSPKPKRSGSTGRLAVQDNRVDHLLRQQNQFGSLGRVNQAVQMTQIQSDPYLSDSRQDDRPYETVFVMSHGNSCYQIQGNVLSEKQFLGSCDTALTDADPLHSDASEVYTDLFGTSGTAEHANDPPPVKRSNPVSQSQSSSGLSRSSGDVGEADVHEDDVGDANSSPRHGFLYDRLLDSSECNLLDNSFTGDGGLDVLNTTNEEELLGGEDRSNDRSSDVSERSGCTSLASSAHALGRRMQHNTVLADCSLTSDDLVEVPEARASQRVFNAVEPPDCSSTGRTRHSGQPSSVEAVEKRTRFSVSEFSRANDSYGPRQETQRATGRRSVQRSSFGATERDHKPNGCNSLRTRLVRTTSAELLLRHDVSRRLSPIAAIGLPAAGPSSDSHQPTPSNPKRSSSLNNLQSASGFRVRSIEMQETQDGNDSLPTPDTQEADERSSVRTCSSCGIHLTGGEALPRTTDAPRVPLDDSNLNGRLDEDDALSDLPLSSANVSGRVTPLSLASSASRATSGVVVPHILDHPNTSRGHAYSRSGFVLPTPPVTLSTSGGVGGSVGTARCCLIDFPPTILQRNMSSDVTDKFGKFDLPPVRIAESEARSTVSDTWSTDVLPSDTEYPDIGPDLLGSDIPSGRPSHHNHHHHHRHHYHRHHHHRNHHDTDNCNQSAGHVAHPGLTGAGSIRPVADARSGSARITSDEVSPTESHSQPNQSSPNSQPTSIHVELNRHEQSLDLDATASQRQNSIRKVPRIPNGSVVQLDVRRRLKPSEPRVHTTPPSTTAPTLNAPHGDNCSTQSIRSLQSCPARNATCDTPSGDVMSTSSSSTRLAGVQLIKDGCSRLKSKVVLRSRFSLKQSVNPTNSPRSVFHWNPDSKQATDSTKRMEETTIPTQPDSNIGTRPVADAGAATTSQPVPEIAPLSSSLASLSSRATNSSSASSSAHSLNIDPDDFTTHVAPDTSANTLIVRGEESVDQMMARYRMKMDSVRRMTVNFSLSTEAKSSSDYNENPRSVSSTGLFGDWTSDTRSALATQSLESIRERVRHGLRIIFSNSNIRSVGRQILDKAEFALQASARDTHLRSQGFKEEDAFFFIVLQALLAEAIAYQDSALVTTIRETGRLFRLLVDGLKSDQLVQTEARSSKSASPSRYNTIVPGLLADLRSERRHRRAYFAYLIRTSIRVAQANQHLNSLKLRIRHNLSLQCDNLLYNAITSFLDSQLELFEDFYARLTKARSSSEAEELPCVARGLVNQFIHTLVTKWNALSLQLFSAPLDDPDFAYLSTSVSGPSHLIRLVMEKVYRSGIWMNDASVERERDVLLHRELASLGHLFTANDLQIPERFHILQPFISVQEELRLFDRSHVPNEMLQRLKSVNDQIVTTLALVSPDSPPSADDLLPVLIYVIIQVNPPRLLTNIAFIETFGSNLEGGDQYSWCQFRAAVAEVRRLLSAVLLDEDSTHSHTG